MKVTRVSDLSRKTNSRELDITEDQLRIYGEGKELIQNVFPNLSVDDREFIKSGITSEEWDIAFGGGEE